MRLTQKSKYAVRALMELALNERDCPLGVAEIARRQRIPERFLEQIFGELRRANIIESHRGAHGVRDPAAAPRPTALAASKHAPEGLSNHRHAKALIREER